MVSALDSISSANLMSPDFPVVSDKAKAGILKTVQAFISQMDLHSPVIASSANFLNFTHSSGYSWTRIKYGSAAPLLSIQNNHSPQSVALADTFCLTESRLPLGVPPLDHQSIRCPQLNCTTVLWSPSFSVDQLKEQYRKSLGITPRAITPLRLGYRGDRFGRLYDAPYRLQQLRLLSTRQLCACRLSTQS